MGLYFASRVDASCSEAVGSDFETVIVSENIGKAGSLKKNYGGFSLKKRRRKIQPLDENDEEKTKTAENH